MPENKIKEGIINVLWIKPQDTQLKIVPGPGSPLEKLVDEPLILSYDNQMNYPFTTTLTLMRQLQSALGDEATLHGSILNLSAVPREDFAHKTWQENYLGDVYKEIPFGYSTIECRRIGKDISEIDTLDEIVQRQDLVVIPISFETHVNEVARLGKYLKERYGDSVKVMASGTGVEGHEEYLLNEGLDVVFIGEVTDKGEQVLKAIKQEDYKTLSSLPGVFSDLGGYRARNLGARNFRRDPESRAKDIIEWNRNIGKYMEFVPISFEFVGRPDLVNPESSVHPVIQHCNAFQDVDYGTLTNILPEGEEIYLAADDISVQKGCQENCDFCHAAGRGVANQDAKYINKMVDFYKSMGATSMIVTSDQLLFKVAYNIKAAKQYNEILKHIRKLGMHVLYGNGESFSLLAKIIDKAREGSEEQRRVYAELLGNRAETMPYAYYPFERLEAMVGKPGETGLGKLRGGLEAYLKVLEHTDRVAEGRGHNIEIGTNIILNPEEGKEDMERFYNFMDPIANEFSHLTIRYNAFFLIPSNAAPHIKTLKEKYGAGLYSEKHPELKVVSIPQITPQGEDARYLEKQLAENIAAAKSSKSKRMLGGGAYYPKEPI